MANTEPVPLTLARIEDAAGVLLRFFTAGPGLRFVLPDVADRGRLGPSLARSVVQSVHRRGAPLVTSEPVRGVALWFPPDAPIPTAADPAATGIAAVRSRIGPAAWRRLQRLLIHLDPLHQRSAPEPHWYLAMLGVDPPWPRQGSARR